MTLTIGFREPLAGLGPFTDYDLAPLEGAPDTYTLRASAQPTIRLFVVDAAVFMPEFVYDLGDAVGADSRVFLVVTPRADGVTVNLLAPLIVDVVTRTGDQVIATDDLGRVQVPLQRTA
jgi:flagellar assembly factor FliW